MNAHLTLYAGIDIGSLSTDVVLLDGNLAARGWFPAVDPLRSLSRLMPIVAGPAQRAAAARVRASRVRSR